MINIGDIVSLKGQRLSPKMTVIRNHDNRSVVCGWFYGSNKYNELIFDVASLIKLEN